MAILAVGNGFKILPNQSTVVSNDKDGQGINLIHFQVFGSELYSATEVQSDFIVSDGLMIISMWFGDSYQHHLSFIVQDRPVKKGAYSLDNPMEQYANVRIAHQGCQYSSEELYQGVLMVTHFDSSTKIISGSFELLALSQECNDLIRITEGQFDIQLKEEMSL
jgi:hypothetical protein